MKKQSRHSGSDANENVKRERDFLKKVLFISLITVGGFIFGFILAVVSEKTKSNKVSVELPANRTGMEIFENIPEQKHAGTIFCDEPVSRGRRSVQYTLCT